MKAGGGHEGGTGEGGGCVGRGGGGGGGDGDDGGGGGGGEGGNGGKGGGESGGNGGEPSGRGGYSLELFEAGSIILSVPCCCKSISRVSFVNEKWLDEVCGRLGGKGLCTKAVLPG